MDMACNRLTALGALALAAALWAPHADAVAQAACALVPAFEQTNVNVPAGKTPVSKSADGRALLFTTGLHVNTDGTPRSYKVDDFWGEHEALNNLCNAMSDACAGLDNNQLRRRRELTQAAARHGWPAGELRATRISPSIIAHGADGRPCTGADGFLVSATSLKDPSVTDVCDIRRYADALQVSALVLPRSRGGAASSGFAAHGARMGDLAAVWLPGSPDVHFAVIGDHGPASKLGEASIALNGRLLGKTEPPVNYLHLRGRPPYRGQGWNVPRAHVLVFPGTRDPERPYMTQARIDEAAAAVLQRLGGVTPFLACAP